METDHDKFSFRDAAGGRWTLALNVQLLDDVMDETGVDLLPGIDNTMRSMIDLYCDVDTLGGILWLLCREQAEGKTVDNQAFTAEEFREVLDGKALTDGWDAMKEAVLCFIQDPKRVEAIRAVVDAELKMLESGATEMMEAVKEREE